MVSPTNSDAAGGDEEPHETRRPVTRAESLVLGLGTLSYAPDRDITIDHDPRVEEIELAREVRYIDRPGDTHPLVGSEETK